MTNVDRRAPELESVPGGVVSPLEYLHEHVRANGASDVAAIERLASALRSTPARVRGVLSFYDDLHAHVDEPRVCAGTSCSLARGAAESPPGRTVYCLGYCDRSPAILRGERELSLGGGELHARADACDVQPARSDVRCLAREPIVTRRLQRGDFSSLAAARDDGAYEVLAAALRGTPERVLDAVIDSGERGRGGAAYSTGAKWRACARASGSQRYVIANGDEGDPGSFVDRELMERDPHGILEGLLLCAFAVGASRAIVFVRAEYPWAQLRIERAIDDARAAGLIGHAIRGGACDVEVMVVRGLGSYVCGEETALIHAIEGRRGEVGIRPPYPTERGLFGCPTVVNNVETLVNVPWIVAHGPAALRALGTPDSAGTKAICLDHGFARPGIVEVEFGTPLDAVVANGGGGAHGAAIDALAIGGPMGSIVGRELWRTPVCYRGMAEADIELGHGGIVALHEGADLVALAHHGLAFMAHESCGRCAPCALGSKSALALAERGGGPSLEALLDTIEATSACAFGQLVPRPVRELLQRARAQRKAP